jgi:type II secretory pathway pseudopilin PulG
MTIVKIKTKLASQAGMTIIELLIAAIMTISVVSAAFNFYVKSHQQYISQEDISEAQENLRASVEEIGRQIRMAGYNLPDSIQPIIIDSVSTGSDTLVINRDTLTIRYYVDQTDTLNPTLIKEVEGRAEIYSEQIKNFQVTPLSNMALRITLQSQGYKYDHDIRHGKRVERTESKVVTIRNIN